MVDLSVVLQTLTLIVVSVGSFLLYFFKAGAEATIKTAAEESVKAAIKAIDWPKELGRELQKVRGAERQELRFESYGALWNAMAPLAIYESNVIDKHSVRELSTNLSKWYFGKSGGLVLTREAKEFYFTLQGLLKDLSDNANNWEARRPEGLYETHKQIMQQLLQQHDCGDALKVYDYFDKGDIGQWEEVAGQLGSDWNKGIARLTQVWSEFTDQQRFTILQQVGSVLRSALSTDLESKFR